MAKKEIPSPMALMNPLIHALKNLGGSGSIEEIDNKVSEIAQLSDEQLEVIHDPERGTQTEVEYRLAWARTYLKKYGILENSGRGVWALISAGSKINSVNPNEVARKVRSQIKQSRQEPDASSESPYAVSKWRDILLSVLLSMKPEAFERLVQRMLRESGFIQVEVTGRSGDGGIDGKGLLRLGGFLSFHIIFQCKRWKGTVSAAHIRDFRGAMVGRADKGLYITTGMYTKDAVREATRDGAPAIDLIDGEQFTDKLKELSLGVITKIVEVEDVQVNQEWFASI